jgi:hypothetical protein
MRTTMKCLCLVGMAVLWSGCGIGLSGRICSLADGVVFPMEIETSYGHGTIHCDNPATGEHFEGTYSGVSGGASGIGTSASYANLGSVHGSATGLSGVFVQSLKANAMALLIGDRGTILDCRMGIQRGIRPHGMGVCVDNTGKAYRLQF